MITLTEQEEINRDLDLWEAERNWRASLPKHSEVEWLRIFPEAMREWKPRIVRRMKLERMFLEAHLQDRRAEAFYSLKTNHYPWRDDLIKDAARRDIARIERQIRAIDGRLAYLKTLGSKKVDGIRKKGVVITDDMIANAKAFPIGELVEVNRRGYARCIGHTDQHPSAYCKKNFMHCFVCNKSWDTIAILMERDGLGFREAVMKLQN